METPMTEHINTPLPLPTAPQPYDNLNRAFRALCKREGTALDCYHDPRDVDEVFGHASLVDAFLVDVIKSKHWRARANPDGLLDLVVPGEVEIVAYRVIQPADRAWGPRVVQEVPLLPPLSNADEEGINMTLDTFVSQIMGCLAMSGELALARQSGPNGEDPDEEPCGQCGRVDCVCDEEEE
jgi:hypothetical protein